MKLLRFSVILTHRSLFRNVTLVLIFSLSIIVFVIVSEMSRVSTEGLQEAIIKDRGFENSYSISFQESVSISEYELYEAVANSVSLSGGQIWGMFEELPQTPSECPPYEVLGEVSFRVAWVNPEVLMKLPFGDHADVETEWCLSGQTIPDEAIYIPSSDNAAILGLTPYLRFDYRALVLADTVGSRALSFLVLAGDGTEEDIRNSLLAQFEVYSALNGVNLGQLFIVTRLDRGAQFVDQAAEGVSAVYDIIRWAVLVLAAGALITVQAIVVRQRLWFFGMIRALGAPKSTLGRLILVDSLVVFGGGFALAIVFLVSVRSILEGFLLAAFGIKPEIMSAAFHPLLLLSILALGLLSAFVSIITATRQDPLVTLEASRD